MNTCNKEGCWTALRVYDDFYKSLPEDTAIEMVERKFNQYRDNLQNLGICEGVCYPLIEIISRIDEEEMR